MARLVLTAVGTIVGAYFGYPQLGAALGSLAGAALEPKQKIQGRRLEDLTAPRLAYGSSIPRIYGRQRVSGCPIWASSLQPVETTEDIGKGGGTEVTNTTYKLDLLMMCAIDTDAIGIGRVWVNKKLVYSVVAESTPGSVAASLVTPAWEDITLFDGNPAQLPWSIYEAAVGIGNAPAYRHRVTIGIQGLDVGGTGQLPMIEVEIITAGTLSGGLILDAQFASDESDTSPAPVATGTINNPGNVLFPGDYVQLTNDTVGSGQIIYTGGKLGTAGDLTTFIMDAESISYVGAGTGGAYIFFRVGDSLGFIGTNASFAFRLISDGINVVSQIAVTSVVQGARNSGQFKIEFDTLNEVINLYIDGDLVQTQAVPGIGEPVAVQVGYGGSTSLPYPAIYQVSSVYGFVGEAPVQSITAAPVDLADIVTVECARVGLEASQIDVIDLVGIDVTGYATFNGARQTLEELGSIFYFEAFATDKLVLRRRGGASAVTIAYEDTGAAPDSAGDPFNGFDRADDLAVPAFYSVTYSDLSRDYEPGSVMSDRLIGESSEVRQLQCAVVMTSAEAKGRADAYSLDARVASHSSKVALGISHIRRTPTDVLTLTDADGTTYRSRIVRQTFADMVFDNEIVLDDATALRETGIAPPDGEGSFTVTPLGVTTIEYIDGPILREADNDPGWYAASLISGGNGTGSRLFKSIDDVSFAKVVDINEQAILGAATTILPTFTGGYVWDEINSVTVTTSGALSSSTKAAMQADRSINVAAIKSGSGWEYIRFRTATLIGTLEYTLRGLLRGVRGTEAFMSGHAVGDHFVLLRMTGMRRIPGEASEIGVSRYYRGVTIGAALNSATSTSFTNNAVGLKPFSPARLRADRDTSGNITFHVGRRTRLFMRIGGSGGTLSPLGETTEAYQIDIRNAGVVVRTLIGTSESVPYSAAEQTIDFGSPQATVDAEVFQISTTVGRGTGLRKTAA